MPRLSRGLCASHQNEFFVVIILSGLLIALVSCPQPAAKATQQAGDSSWTLINPVNGTAPAFLGSFHNYASVCGFRKDGEGFVHMEGTATNGSTSIGFSQIFVMPAGYRPLNQNFNYGDNVNQGITITNTDGTVYVSSSTGYINFDGVIFYAGQ